MQLSVKHLMMRSGMRSQIDTPGSLYFANLTWSHIHDAKACQPGCDSIIKIKYNFIYRYLNSTDDIEFERK